MNFTAFWAINDELDLNKMKQQLDEMKALGLDGIIFHPRNYTGKPEYMGKEYLSILSEIILYAKRHQMLFWIYDENGWPSGGADGQVIKHYPEIKCQWFEWNDHQIIWKEKNQINSLDPKGVQLFIELTHEKYKMGLNPDAFEYLEGFFSDEVGFMDGHGASVRYGGIPWCPQMEQKYRERYGVEIKEKLPLLFVEEEGFLEVRYRYWELLAECLADSFYKPINEWCISNGKKFTGHLKGEENLYFQVPYNGSAFRLLKNVNVPAVDALERYPSGNFFPKIASSLAKQFYEGEALAEAIGGSGWGLRPEDFVTYFDWLAENGISTFTIHLQQYTLKAEAIRDWPPSFPLHMNWKEVLPTAIERVRMIHEKRKQQKSSRQILLVAPARGVRAYFEPVASMTINEHNGTNLPECKAVDISNRFNDLVEDCIASGINFDVTDEQLLEEYGTVTEEGVKLGNMVYDAVIFGEKGIFENDTIFLKIKEAGKETSLILEQKLHGIMEEKQNPTISQVIFTQTPWEVQPIGENQLLLELKKQADDVLTCMIHTMDDFRNDDLKLVLSDAVKTVKINGITLTSTDGLIYPIHNGVTFLPPEKKRVNMQYELTVECLEDGEQHPFVFIKGNYFLKTNGMWTEKDAHQWKYQGDFLLSNPWQLTETGDFIRGGLPFMAKPVELQKQLFVENDVQLAVLRLMDIKCDAALVIVDGIELGYTFGPDWSMECGNLTKGNHTLSLKLIPNTFNTYGPHHHLDGDRHLTSPMQYEGVKNFADYNHSPEITLVEDWHFVKFGISDTIEIYEQ